MSDNLENPILCFVLGQLRYSVVKELEIAKPAVAQRALEGRALSKLNSDGLQNTNNEISELT